MGEPLVQLAVTRATVVTRLAPGYSDDLMRWQDLSRRIVDNDIFGIMLSPNDTSQGFVVRPLDDEKWTQQNIHNARGSAVRMQSPWTLEESIGP
jgi:hypothetical protein